MQPCWHIIAVDPLTLFGAGAFTTTVWAGRHRTEQK